MCQYIDILSRFGELGVFVKDGKLLFNPCLLRKNEFLSESKSFNYVDVNFKSKTIDLKSNSICFTYCQIPVIYKISNQRSIEVLLNDEKHKNFESLTIDKETSKLIFERTGEIMQIIVNILESELK